MSTAIFMDSGKRKHNSRTARSYSLIKTTEAAPAVLKNARFKKQQLIFDLLLLFFIHLNFFSLNPPSAHSDRSFSTRHPHNAHPSPAARTMSPGFPFPVHCSGSTPVRKPPYPHRKRPLIQTTAAIPQKKQYRRLMRPPRLNGILL